LRQGEITVPRPDDHRPDRSGLSQLLVKVLRVIGKGSKLVTQSLAARRAMIVKPGAPAIVQE
jgi:hypothetical protein